MRIFRCINKRIYRTVLEESASFVSVDRWTDSKKTNDQKARKDKKVLGKTWKDYSLVG